MTTISATIIADSMSLDGIRLTTMHLRYPRFLLAEFNTHRVFSRNSRSSRAVPVETMIREIETDPVVPLHWGANQKGMQAEVECNRLVGSYEFPSGQAQYVEVSREDAWLKARDHAVVAARGFHEAGYHKQVVNRLLEPFMHIDTLVTATEWANFLALRDHPAAEPHIAMLARAMKAAIVGSAPAVLEEGQWHLPYVREDEFDLSTEKGEETAIKVSVARCARISYRPFDGEGSVEAEIARHDALVGSVPMHASPAEHQARAEEWDPAGGWKHPTRLGNLRGFVQYRKLLAGENLGELVA